MNVIVAPIIRFFLSFLIFISFTIIAFAQPIINDISPSTGPIGTIVTINGSGFLNSVDGNAVFFGTIKGTIIGVPTSSSIQVAVPPGAIYGRIIVQSNVTAPPLYATSPNAFHVTDGSVSCGITTASFLPLKNFVVGSNSPKKGIARGDLDGDGKVDLVIIENASNLVYVLKNTSSPNGKIAFTTGLTFAGSSTTMTDVAISDLDGDKKPDLIFTNSSAFTITCFRNTSTIGSISFSSAINITPVANLQPFALVVGDVDRDGKHDIVIANRANSKVSILRNTSQLGSITFSSTVTTINCGSNPNSITLADINNDGKRDLITANSGSNTISIIQNNSTSASMSFGTALDVSAGGGSIPQVIVNGDLNEDGKTDLIVACKGTNKIVIFENLGLTSAISNASIGTASQINIPSSNYPIDVDLGDMNGDGLPDIVVASQIAGNLNALCILRNTHQASTTSITLAPAVSYSTTTNQIDKLALGDYNLDGRTDVAISYTNSIPAAGAYISIFQKDIQLKLPDGAGPITSSAPLCSGQTATFEVDDVVGATSYNWSVPNGVTIVSGGNTKKIIANLGVVAGTENIMVTPVNSCNYGAASFVSIDVQQNPTIISTSPVTRCDSGAVTLSATSNLGSVLWYYQAIGGTSISTGNTFTTEKLTSSTNYYVEAYIGGCVTPIRKLVTATVNLLPNVTASAVDKIICFGSTTTLQATGASAYSWLPTHSISAGDIANPIAYPSDTTLYTVTGMDLNGCVNFASIKVNVNPIPNITALTIQSTICDGTSTELRAQGAMSYLWSPDFNLNNVSSQNPIAAPSNTTTYNVLGTDQNGCSNNASISIVVNPKPNVKAFSNITTSCAGGVVELISNGAINYSWKQDESLSETTISSPSARPKVNTTFVVTGTDANNCINSDSIKINVNPNPVLRITSDNAAVCIGSSTSFVVSGANKYVWDNSPDLSSLTIASPITTPANIGDNTYFVTGTDLNNCISNSFITIKVNTLPAINAAASLTTLCEGTSSQLNASGAINYSWMPSATLNSPVGSSPVATPIAGTTVYTVTGTDINNCANVANVAITANALPAVTVNATLKTICIGNETALSASGALNYIWSPATTLNSINNANSIAKPTASITYTVTGTDGNSCTNIATISIIVNPIPTITTTTSASNCGAGNLILEAVSSFGTISWFDTPTGGTSLGNGNKFNTELLSNSKSYYVEASNLGCVSTTRSLVVANINAIPIVNITTLSNDTICLGSSLTLSGSGANAYIWNTTAKTQNITVTPTATTSYSLSGTDQNLCSNTSVFKVIVIPIPSIVSTTAGFRCGEGTVTMGATATNGEILWYRSPTTTVVRGKGNFFTTTIDIVNTTSYYVEASEFGCTSPTRIPVIATINIPVISPATLPTGDIGFLYSKSMTVSNLAVPTWSYTGDLPTGVSLDASTGKLAGQLTEGGVFIFTLHAEQAGCNASQTYTITINIVKQTTTWNGTNWSNGPPNATTDAVMSGNYTVFTNGDIICDNLTVLAGKTLTIDKNSTVTIKGSIINNGVINQHCTATLTLNGTTSGNAIQLIQPKLTPEALLRGKVNNPYNQNTGFKTSFGTSALVFDIIGTLPSGLSIVAGSNKISGTPIDAGVYTFKITATDGNCYSVTPDIKLTIVDLLSTSLQFKDHITVKNWGDVLFKLPINTTSNAPITYSINPDEKCAKVDSVSGEISFQCASSNKGIWITARQERNLNFKESVDSSLLYILKLKPTLILNTNKGILINKPVLFEFTLTNGYDGPVSKEQISGDSIATILENGLIEAKKTGAIQIAIKLPSTENYLALDTVFTFNTYVAKQSPIARYDTILLTRNLDGTLNVGFLEPLKNDVGITGTLKASLIDIDLVNPGIQNILFVPSVGTFVLDTATGGMSIRPFVGYSGKQRIPYYIIDSDGLQSAISYIIINVESFKQNIKANEVMSPNNDGLNDALIVGFTDIFKANKISVFDEVGNTVYETNNYQNDWLGTNNHGKLLEPGVYNFVFKELEGELRELIGYIQIVR